ncbi:hypothetical protein [Formosa sp. S-31]|uniref:hypothetical protein n=1 Tax=Formosa sp. S-31 TaxID=2790949 RepID=UPI003EC08DF9
MKYVSLIACIVIFSTCANSKTNTITAQNQTVPAERNAIQNEVFLEYLALTRGSFLEIKIENHKILVKHQQHGPDKINDISDVEWDVLMDELHAVNLNELNTLKAPSEKRAHDGALSARLKVIDNNTIYVTPEFDHGNPNTKIKPLTDYILSLAKKVE